MIRRAIGITLILMVAVIVVGLVVVEYGWLNAIVTFGISGILAAMFIGGLHLLTD